MIRLSVVLVFILSGKAFAVSDTQKKTHSKVQATSQSSNIGMAKQDKHYDVQDFLPCKGFIENDRYAHLGKTMIQRFSQNKLQALWYGPSDFNRICPEYGYFDQKNRINLWAYILSYMAYFESSCRAKIENPKAPNGVAQGLFQLPKNKEVGYAKDCRRGDSSDGDRSVVCALSILEGQMQRNEPLFSNKSYWAVLRPDLVKEENKKRRKKRLKEIRTDAALVIRNVTDNMCQLMAETSELPSRKEILAAKQAEIQALNQN